MKIITEGDGRVEPEHFDPKILSLFKIHEQEINEIFEKINASEMDFRHIFKSNTDLI